MNKAFTSTATLPLIVGIGLLLVSAPALSEKSFDAASGTSPRISHTAWGVTSKGQAVDLFTLRNPKGMEVRITNYGCVAKFRFWPLYLRSLAVK